MFVAVARRGEAPLAKIARDFRDRGGNDRNWVNRADVGGGSRPG